MRWLSCLLPPSAFIVHQMTLGQSDYNAITAAAIFVVWPMLLIAGYGFTVCLFGLAQFVARERGWSRRGFLVASLGLIGVINLIWEDWLLWSVLQTASVPPALILALGVSRAPKPKMPSV